ncbi:glutathione S-transferase family protein [Gluconobacter oxydans]|uniref:glutathione S-transferase family protein n=1 Tax=Gluconobacter oxydans TaxID=442 RepID=UPI00062CAB07|nr:glutathione S-transferase family protein [Gluconobacter oxydans]
MQPRQLTLVSHMLCPFVQRAAIVLLEKGVPFERINVDLKAKPDWFLAISPTGKVPLLKVRQTDGSDVVLFESVAICEYLDETQPAPRLLPNDPIARAQHRAWIEYGTATLGDAWQFLNATDLATSQARSAAFRDRLIHLEQVLATGPYFGGTEFSLVDAVFAPIFRYFDVLPEPVSAPLFETLPKISVWRLALRARESVQGAVDKTYGDRFRSHLEEQRALLAQS